MRCDAAGIKLTKTAKYFCFSLVFIRCRWWRYKCVFSKFFSSQIIVCSQIMSWFDYFQVFVSSAEFFVHLQYSLCFAQTFFLILFWSWIYLHTTSVRFSFHLRSSFYTQSEFRCLFLRHPHAYFSLCRSQSLRFLHIWSDSIVYICVLFYSSSLFFRRFIIFFAVLSVFSYNFLQCVTCQDPSKLLYRN